VKPAEAGIQQLYIVGNFGHGAHRRAGGSDRVLAVDGDGRRNPLNFIDPGPEAAYSTVSFYMLSVHELPGIGREGFHVTALAFGIEGIKGQGRFARTADTGNDRDLIQRDFKIQVFKVVLSGTFDSN